MRRTIRIVSCFLAAGALASCVSPRPLRETSNVRIGIFADLGSTASREGSDALKGAELRVGEANASGGIGGRQVELVVRYVTGSATDAVKAYSALVQDEGVCAVIGAVVSNAGFLVSPVADLSQVAFVSLSIDDRVVIPGMKPENPEPAGAVRPFAFLVQPSATQAAAAFAGYVVEHFTMKRYATLYDPASPVSVLQARAFEGMLKKSGRTLAASVPMPEGDLASPLRALRDAAVEAVFVCASTEKNMAAAKGIAETLPRAVLLGNPAWYAPQAASTGNNAWFWLPVSPNDSGLGRIAPAYVSRFGEYPRPAMVPGWDAVGLIMAAVAKAGSSGPKEVGDALRQLTSFRALQGTLEMDRKTHRPAFLPLAIMRIVGDTYVTVEPRFVYKPPLAP
ncbi:MAG: ABC transporter substrate-binding protein [Spirochaetia bacterium]